MTLLIIYNKYRPVDDGQRQEVPSAVILLLVVKYNPIVSVRLELDLDTELVVSLQSAHSDVAFAVERRYLVIPFVDLLVA